MKRIPDMKALRWAEAYGANVPANLFDDPCDDWSGVSLLKLKGY